MNQELKAKTKAKMSFYRKEACGICRAAEVKVLQPNVSSLLLFLLQGFSPQLYMFIFQFALFLLCHSHLSHKTLMLILALNDKSAFLHRFREVRPETTGTTEQPGSTTSPEDYFSFLSLSGAVTTRRQLCITSIFI